MTMNDVALAGVVGGAAGAICVLVLLGAVVALVAWIHRDDPFED